MIAGLDECVCLLKELFLKDLCLVSSDSTRGLK